jgi:hypothetical protein
MPNFLSDRRTIQGLFGLRFRGSIRDRANIISLDHSLNPANFQSQLSRQSYRPGPVAGQVKDAAQRLCPNDRMISMAHDDATVSPLLLKRYVSFSSQMYVSSERYDGFSTSSQKIR